MAEPSLFAQRLQAITERCRLREKIQDTRRELEEERLRAQRLKRKSLRDRWLMEGMSASTEDHHRHTTPAWEGQSRIQELEEDLSSLESQMQQLDNPELLQDRQKSKEPAKAVKEGFGISSSTPPEGRSGIESSLETGTAPSKRTVKGAPEDKLQNGEMAEDGFFGFQPALQSQTPNEAHPSHQRKLAVEEMVIRDHLGQAVGSMDAVGQKQISIQKELDEDVTLGNGCNEENRSRSLCGEEEPSSVVEGKIDRELGTRDAPEGESPTSQDQEGPSEPLKNENISKEQANGELFREVVLLDDAGNKLPVEDVQEQRPSVEPVLNGNQYQLSMKSQQDSAGTEITAQEQAGKNLASLQEHPNPSFPDQNPPESEESLQNLIILSSTSEQASHVLPETKGSLPNPVSVVQETEGLVLETETSLLPNQNSSTVLDQTIHLLKSQGCDEVQIPSLMQESYLDPSLPSREDHFSSPVKQNPPQGSATTSLEEAKPSLLEQIPLQGADGCHLDQTPASLKEQSASLPSGSSPPPSDQLMTLPEMMSSSLQETESSPIVLTTLVVQEASVTEAEGCTPDVISSLTNNHASLANKISSSQEAKGVPLEEIPVKMQDQMTTSPTTQSPSFQEAGGNLPGKQGLSSMNEGGRLLLETSTLMPDQVSPVLKETASSQEKKPSLPEQGEPLLPNLTAPGLPEPSKFQSHLGEERPTTLQSQPSPLGDVEGCQGKEIPQPLSEERSTLPGQSPSTHRVPALSLQETGAALDALCPPNQDPDQPILEITGTMEDQPMEENGSVSRASRAAEAGESSDILENVPTEEEPLLNELKTSTAPPEAFVGDQEPKPLVLKSQAAASQEVPTYHSSSANTASSRQLLPHEGEGHDQGQSRRKQKSCQCCSVM